MGDINIWSATKVKNGNTITVTPASWNAKLGQAEWGFCTT
jgi:cellulase/cellobiase CelA1